MKVLIEIVGFVGCAALGLAILLPIVYLLDRLETYLRDRFQP